MGTVVQLGEDPGQMVTRGFVDRDSAVSWIRHQLEIRYFVEHPNQILGNIGFEEREGDPMVTPVSSMPSARM